MFELLVHSTFVATSMLAAGLIVYVSLFSVVQILRWVVARRQPQWLRAVHSLRDRAFEPVTGGKTNTLPRWFALVLAWGLAVKALLTGGWLVGAYLIAVGIALFAYLSRRDTAGGRETITDAVGEFVSAYYSAHLVTPTVFGALDEALKTLEGSKEPGHVQLARAVKRTVDAFHSGKLTEEALGQMVAETRDPYLGQLAFILRHVSKSNQKEIVMALRDLSERLEQRMRLKDKSRVAFALVNGTVRFLQAANVTVIALAVLASFWWNYYAGPVSHQVILIGAATLAFSGSWYFEEQLRQIRERVL